MFDELQLLQQAYDQARQSPDPSNQNGGIAADDNGFVYGRGYNGFTTGIIPTAEQLNDRDWKLSHIEHAERATIFDVASWRDTSDLILVCPWFACDACARAIVMCRIRKVIGHKQRMDTTPERWRASVDAGLNILRSGGVELRFVDHVFNVEPIRVNGQLWVP